MPRNYQRNNSDGMAFGMYFLPLKYITVSIIIYVID